MSIFFKRCFFGFFRRPVFFYNTVWTILILLLFSCNEYKKNKSHQLIKDESISKGKKTGCGLLSILPFTSRSFATGCRNLGRGRIAGNGGQGWVFLAMGFKQYPSNRNDPHLPANYYPDKPVLNYLQWQNIIDYYTALAPDSLPAQDRTDKIKTGLDIFSLQSPSDSLPCASYLLYKN